MLFIIILLLISNVISSTTTTTTIRTCETNDLSLNTINNNNNNKTITWAIICLIRKKDTVNNMSRNKALVSYLSKYSSSHNFTILMFSEDKFTNNDRQIWSNEFQNVGIVHHIDTTENAYWIDGNRKFGYK